MQISSIMNLDELAQLMGDGFTADHAKLFRHYLARDFNELDTSDVPDSVWDGMMYDLYEDVEFMNTLNKS